jgi:hypothetical protein
VRTEPCGQSNEDRAMTCADCQQQFLDAALNSVLNEDAQAHLTTCQVCRTLDREVRLNLNALSDLRTEVIPTRRPSPLRWYGASAIAAALILAIGLSLRPNSPPIRVETAALPPAPAPSPIALKPVAPKPTVPTSRRRAAHRKPAPVPVPTFTEPVLMRVMSDDPDVVIYWQLDPVPTLGDQAL